MATSPKTPSLYSRSPQVSNIAQSILSELDRVRGTKMTLTLDIDAETADGFPEDVESVVRDNAASLRITDFGFEGEYLLEVPRQLPRSSHLFHSAVVTILTPVNRSKLGRDARAN
jgi:hypothetical protein